MTPFLRIIGAAGAATWLGAASCLTACYSSGQKTGEDGYQHPVDRNTPIPHNGSSTISGSVSLDGQPVEEFAIAVVPSGVKFPFEPPITIRSAEGRFTLPMGSETWNRTLDLLFVGRGFKRTRVRGLRVSPDHPVAPLSIQVGRGSRVEGIVTDPAGNRLAHATVRIEQSTEAPDGSVMWDLARGNHRATSDHTGAFTFDDVEILAARAEMFARSSAGERSLTRLIDSTTSWVHLTLVPTGTVQGVVRKGRPDTRFLQLRPLQGQVGEGSIPIPYADDGSFVMSEIPVGTYVVALWVLSSPRSLRDLPVRVVVSANQVTTVSVTIPDIQP